VTSTFVGFVRSDEVSKSRVLRLADIFAPKVKTSTTDEEVRFFRNPYSTSQHHISPIHPLILRKLTNMSTIGLGF
jgi:hypothetical protein